MRPVLISLITLISLALAGGPAQAADVSVAVLGLDAVEAPDTAAQAVTDAIRQRAAEQKGLRLVPGKDLVEVKLVFGCMEERVGCMATVGRSLGVERLIYGSLRRPRDDGGYTVTLKQLDVPAGRVEKFISEIVPARVLNSGSVELYQLARKWLDVLLLSELHGGLQVTSDPAGAEVSLDGKVVGRTPLELGDVQTGNHVAVLALPGYQQVVETFTIRGGLVHEVHAILARRGKGAGALPLVPRAGQEGETGPPQARDIGKPLRLASYFLIGAAALTGGVAIYTWRTYTGEEDPARQALNVLQTNLPASSAVNNFFHSPEALSSCQPPPELTTQAMASPITVSAYNDYLDHCRRGQSYAGATTGLVATMGSLALLGVLSYIIGQKLHHPERKVGPDDAYKPKLSAEKKPSWLYTPRLTELSPTVSAQGGGINLNIQF